MTSNDDNDDDWPPDDDRSPDDDGEYMEKIRQNKKFKFFRVFMIHNFEANCSQ